MKVQLPVEAYSFAHNPGLKALHLNESDFQHHPAVAERLMAALQTDPDLIVKYNNRLTVHEELLDLLVQYTGVQDSSQLLLVNGADEALLLTLSTFREHSTVIVPKPSYRQYARYCAMLGRTVQTVAVENCLAQIRALLRSFPREKRLVLLCNPNNPTGTLLPGPDITALAQQFPAAVFVVDESYADYRILCDLPGSTRLPVPVADNVIIVRSFSKAFALAGLRLGYIASCSDNIAALSTMFNHKNVPLLVKHAAAAVLEHLPHYVSIAQQVHTHKSRLRQCLQTAGFSLPYGGTEDAHCNFICASVPTGTTAADFCDYMQSHRATLVRDVSSSRPHCVRITVGTERTMQDVCRGVAEYSQRLRWQQELSAQLNCHFFVINLADRVDRLRACQQEFKRVGLHPVMNYFTAQRHSAGGTAGCWESHKQCLQRARQACGDEPGFAVIFEDDCVFDQKWASQMQHVVAALRSGLPFDLLYLGGLVYSYSSSSSSSGLQGLRRAVCNNAHAYIASTAFMDRVLQDPGFCADAAGGLGVDDYYKLHGSNYILTQAMAWQRGSAGSDTQWYASSILQRIVQQPQLYELLQRTNNQIAWRLRALPAAAQTLLNPVACLFWWNEQLTAGVHVLHRLRRQCLR